MVRIGLDETAHKIFAVRPDEAYTVADIRRQLDLFKAQGRRVPVISSGLCMSTSPTCPAHTTSCGWSIRARLPFQAH